MATPVPPSRPARGRRARAGTILARASRLQWVAIVVGVVALAAFVVVHNTGGSGPQAVDYSDLVGRLATDHQVETVTVSNGSGRLKGDLKDPSGTGTHRFSVAGPQPPIPDDIEALRASGATVQFSTSTPDPFDAALPYAVALAALLILGVWVNRRAQGTTPGGLLQVGKSRPKTIDPERPRTTFADIAGYEGVKIEVGEVVDFLRNPARYRELGAKIPKGLLLVGPPGTGKTLFARAVAGETGGAFLSVTGSDFMEMFVGVGAARVRDLFATAAKQGPAIIFVDEIDSIGRKRGAGLGGGHDEREQTLNQLLSEMDGFEANEGVVVLAATNRPDILDPALLRPGRFDRQVVVPLPDLDERIPILRLHARDKRMARDVDFRRVARSTPGMSGADLANLLNEAALGAVRRGGREIAMYDIENARDRVLLGRRRESVVLSEKEKEATAFHEGGHAVCAYVLPDADPVHKVTILPTGMALGATQQLPTEDRHTLWREHLEAILVVLMGGRCAEQIVHGTQSSGAGNDLQRATELARRMVRELGMSERIGPMAWSSGDEVFLGQDLVTNTRDHADETARVIDEEIARILRGAEARATELLTTHRAGLDAVAHALLAKETIDGAEVSRLVDSAFGRPVHAAGPKSIAIPRFADALGGPPPPPEPATTHVSPRYPADYGYADTSGYDEAPPPPPPSAPPYDIERDPTWAAS